MTNDELKKKIANIIDNVFENRCRKTNCQNCDLYPDEMCQPNMYADALIAAGIGDVKETERKAFVYSEETVHLDKKLKEAQRRAEVAEMALQYACKSMLKNRNDKERRVRAYFNEYLKKAEKELAEEKKDG